MLDINVVSFLVFDMLILGMSITAFHDLFGERKFHNYWRWALAFFALAYFALAIAPFVGREILTLANLLVLCAGVAQALLFRTWNQPVGKRLLLALAAAIVLLTLVFEYLRQFGTFQQRSGLISGVLISLCIWHIAELWRLHRREPNFFVKLMLLFSSISLVFAGLRWIVVVYGDDPAHATLYSEQIWASATRWALMASDVLTYIAVNGYYNDKSWRTEKEALQAQLHSQQIIETLSREVDQTTQLNKNLALVLSEKNKLLSSLSSSMKSTRMGAMASSMAHEINQPLSAIRLNAEMVQADLQNASGLEYAKSNIRYLIEDADRIGVIVNKIKQFFYNDYSDFKDLQLSELVDASFDYVLEDCQRARIDVVIDIDPKLRVHGDKGQLQMVVFNLVSNAKDELKRQDGLRRIIVQAYAKQSHIDLEVQDNGAGVPAEIADQIFDLFRTTKPEGMGVGLWLSRAVMENHRGQLTYSNMPEGGARFVMQFPAPVAQT
jgi:signal transduction histidine kinase